VRCFRLPRLVEELARYAAMQRRSALFRQLAKADVLVLDSCCGTANVEQRGVGVVWPASSAPATPH
jgi:DNA replication protein DnaC